MTLAYQLGHKSENEDGSRQVFASSIAASDVQVELSGEWRVETGSCVVCLST